MTTILMAAVVAWVVVGGVRAMGETRLALSPGQVARTSANGQRLSSAEQREKAATFAFAKAMASKRTVTSLEFETILVYHGYAAR